MRLPVRSFALSLIFAGLTLAGDNTPPKLTAFSFSPTTIDTSTGNVIVSLSVSATDDLSGPRNFQAVFLSPDGQVQRGADSQLFASGQLQGTTTGSVVFPKSSQAGIWTVQYVSVYDQVGNGTTLNTGALVAAGFPTRLTVVGTSDNTPPQLTTFSFSSTTIDTSTESVTVSLNVSATDDLSGLRNFQAVFLSPDGQVQRGADSQLFASGQLQGTTTGSVVFPKSSQAGIWTVQYVSVYDQVGNGTTLNTGALAAAGFPTQLTVVGTSDVSPPQLTTLSFSSTTIDTSTESVTVSLNVSATDDLSGPRNFQAVFLSPDGQVQRGADSQLFASGQLQGTTTGSVVFPKSSQSGTWTVQYISVYDQAGNGTTLNTSALAAAGFPTQLTVAGDTQSPASLTATSGTPQSAMLGTAFPSALQATVKDSAGNLLSGVTVTFVPPPAGASATLSSFTAVTNASGIASVTATANNTAGSYTVTANVGSLSAAFSLTNTPTSGSVTATGGTPQSATAGTAFPNALQVTVKNSAGNPLNGVTVVFAAPPAGASAVLSSPTAVTNASGIASVTATANSISGSYTVTATVGALSASFSLTNTTSQATSITATGGASQSTTIGAAFATALQATVKDSLGNPVSGVTVNFAAPPTGASATLSSPTAVTNVSGIASVTATANGISGSYTVTANVGALSASFSLTNTTSQAASITATGGTPQSTTVGTAFAIALQATVKNSAGNPVSGVTVVFAAPPSVASATLSSPTAVTNASGVASVTATANSISGSYTVTANVGALSTAFSLTNTSSQAATVTATGGTPQSAPLGTPFAAALQATVKDSQGNPLSGVTVTFAAPSSGASANLAVSTAVTNASGIASVTATANSIPGSYTVTANVGASSASFSLTNTSLGQAASVTATGGTPQSAPLGTAFATALQAVVKNSAGTPLSGVTVTFAAPSTGASATLSSATALTNASGVASVTATANSISGSYTVTASVGSLSASFTLTNTGGTGTVPASIAATGGTPQSAPAGTAFPAALQATVRDSAGNPVPGATVTFGVPLLGASAVLSSSSVVTNASGVASVTATANSIMGSYTIVATVVANLGPGGVFSANFPLTNTPATYASITATGGTPQSASPGAAFPSTLQATVQDSIGNPVNGVTVTFAAPATGASAVLSSFTAVTNLSGIASVSATANSIAGSYIVTAGVGSLSTSFSLTNLPGGGSNSSNLALGKTATQSSTFPGYTTTGPASAVDGNTDGNFSGGSVTATNLDTNAWWQVELGASASVGSVAIFNRLDCCSSRLSDYWVFISNTPFLPADTPATLQNRAGTFGSHQTSAPNPSTTIAFNGAQGRYVRVQLTGSDYLSLAEVQVFGSGGMPPTNLAQGKAATQSSTFPGYTTDGAAAAVDGNADGSFGDGSVTATNLDTNAWWQVDLGASAAVSSVVVWNRADCCASRLSDYWVFISNTPFLPTDTPATLQNRAGTFASHQTAAPSPSTTIGANGAQGRYVRVQLSGADYLSLAEVQVFGPGGAATPTDVALGKSATQSSTFPGYLTDGASAAVDGNTDGSFGDGSVTATNADPNSWWQVDLGASAAVSSIVIWNRLDCCSSRLGDYWVFVSDTPFLATDTPATLQNRAGTFASHQTSMPNPSTTIAAVAQGRYVRVQLSSANYLSLAEVQVFGQ